MKYAILGLLFALFGYSESTQCYDSCITALTDTKLKSKLLGASNEISSLITKYGVNGVAWMLDQTLRQKSHDPSLGNTEFTENGDNIFQFQKDLTYVLAHMSTGLNTVPYYVQTFTGTQGYSCSAYSCLDACEVGKALEGITVQYGADSYKDGQVEHSCSVAKHFMDSVTCDLGTPSQRMAIVVANSDIHEHTRKHDSKWTSHCKMNFPTRMGIGTHAIDGDDIDNFQSSDPWYYLIHDSESNMNAMTTLRTCIDTACCSSPTIGALDDCKYTDPTNHNGDTFTS